MTRILGLCCVKDEADRYLTESLAHHIGFLDDMLVYDDRSTDESVEIAENAGAVVVVRPRNEPSFLEHEGMFRSNALRALEDELLPAEGDWILSFDADEFLVFPSALGPQQVRALLQCFIGYANEDAIDAYEFHVREVFDVNDEGKPMLRVDGYWGDIRQLRFFRYRPDGAMAALAMGSGSVPTNAKVTGRCNALDILHFGYARKGDRIDKHNRYYGLPGHSHDHIESIISTPTLTPWNGPVPF